MRCQWPYKNAFHFCFVLIYGSSVHVLGNTFSLAYLNLLTERGVGGAPKPQHDRLRLRRLGPQRSTFPTKLTHQDYSRSFERKRGVVLKRQSRGMINIPQILVLRLTAKPALLICQNTRLSVEEFKCESQPSMVWATFGRSMTSKPLLWDSWQFVCSMA